MSKQYFDEVFERLAGTYYETSALGAIRIYVPKDVVDLELWAFLCAILDFQIPVRSWLNPMLKGLIRHVEKRNLKFIDLAYNEPLAKDILSSFPWGKKNKGFKHRFLSIDDVLLLLRVFRSLLRDYNSLGTLIKELYGEALRNNVKEPMEYVVKGLAHVLRGYMPEDYGKKGLLIPDPTGDSAFKRLNLLLRWMVRPYPDLGIWKFIDKKYLSREVESKGLSVYDLSEEKAENTLNRITASANPRKLERVPAGVEFSFELSYRVFDIDGDNGEQDRAFFEEYIPTGLKMIMQDTLGGYGSRGCGKVSFIEIEITDEKGNTSKKLKDVDELIGYLSNHQDKNKE